MNHIMFKWDNSYDAYSAEDLNVVMSDRSDIESTCEEDGMHFKSEGDLQPILDTMQKFGMDFEVLQLSKGFTLSAIK